MTRHRRSPAKGSVTVELAITLPVFVIILIGTIETTHMMYLQQSLEIAAYQGARVALISSSTTSKVTSTCNTILNDRNIKGGAVSISPSNYQSQPYGTLLQVRVSAPCNLNSAYSPWFYGGKTLTGEVTMMKEY